MARRKPYEPPRLERFAATPTGKHQLFDVFSTSFSDGPYDLKPLLAEFGSPLFLISELTLRAHFRSFRDTFTAEGVDTQIAYSYKTNYLPAVCSLLHREGAWAEVVSGMEYQLARSLGVPSREIIFNGPHKTREELRRALGEGSLVNVDGFDELEEVVRVARSMRKKVRIGIRINFRLGTNPWTKFGFNEESGDALRALKRISGEPLLQLVALHNHSGTFNLDPSLYGKIAAGMVHLAERAAGMNLRPQILDFGGGFPSENRLKPQFGARNGHHMQGGALAAFAAAIMGNVRRSRHLFNNGRPKVVLEPGRALVDAAVQLACTVVSTKKIPGVGDAVIVDAGVNLLPTSHWYDHEVSVDNHQGMNGSSNESGHVRIFGPLCMQIDVLREKAVLPRVKPGDHLVFSHVGAYCISQSMQFIQTRPAVLLLGPDGPFVVRRRETWRDVFALDSVPPHLRLDGYEL